MRLAWDPNQDPKAVVADLHERFYGRAGRAMSDYWHFVDDVWAKTPEYAGCAFGHLRRWTPERLEKARRLLRRAQAEAGTDPEKARIDLAAVSLRHFEQFMRMRRDLAPLRAGDDIAVELRILTSRRTDLVADRTRAINRLRAQLLEYFPALERAFDYSASKAALVLLTGYQTPDGLRRAGAEPWKQHLGGRVHVG